MSTLGSDVLTSDEEICESFSSLDENLTINESVDSSDEIINKMPGNKNRRPRTIISDDDDEEEQLDRRALSPRTRMSITGICPSDLSSDSSDIDYSVQENNSERNAHSIKECANGSSSTMLNADEQQISNSLIESPVASSRATNIHLPIKEVSPRKSFDHNVSGVRYSSVFENSINDQMSSTVRREKPFNVTIGSEKSNESDILILSRNESVVNISSDDSQSYDEEKQPVYRSITDKKFQPKITAILQETKNSVAKKVVSQDFYDKQVKTLAELRFDLSSAEGLLEKLGPNLYDGGKQLALRVESLKCGLKKKAEEISTFVVENGNPVELEKPKPAKEAPNWDELSAAVNDIKPIYTGKQGLNTFNKQKALTMDRLKDIHGSLESCPGENVFAEDPKDLKVTLMPHQKHALAWMAWREQQKPRGGILADDMGLGKTLTMISMVLAFKTQQAYIHESTDSEGDDDKQGWSAKNRKDYFKGGTLVVCPASLMRQWECEVESKVSRHKLSVCVHHGNNRDSRPRHLSSYDLVITTYNIVSREAKSRGALFGINWQRIILDEAHIVRNHKSQSSEGVCELRGKYRWALTGTPIQNKEMDVYALLKFLKCTPFDDLSHWKKWIDNKSAGGQQRLNTLMKSLMLRRTKALLQEQGSLLCLPERVAEVIEVELDKEEMNVYQKIMTYSKTLFAQFLIQRANKNNDIYSKDPTSTQTNNPSVVYHKIHQKFSKLHHNENEVKSHQILVLLLRLRQICCHPGLIDAMLEGEDGGFSDSDRDDQEIDLLDQLNKLAINDNDISQTLHSDEDVENAAISKASAKVLQKSNPVFNLSRPSSKMNKVLQIVQNQVLNSSDKGIIISQWTSILNILKEHLERRGIRTLSLNGSIPVKNRQSIVTEFNDPNTKPKILLLSLTAGGVGLNLIGANHLLLIDLHWNPQLEMQAQDRIYRVGQKKKVHIYKFMCKDTVEERIKALQDQKLQIAEGLLTGARASDGSKLSIEDLKGLFGL